MYSRIIIYYFETLVDNLIQKVISSTRFDQSVNIFKKSLSILFFEITIKSRIILTLTQLRHPEPYHK